MNSGRQVKLRGLRRVIKIGRSVAEATPLGKTAKDLLDLRKGMSLEDRVAECERRLDERDAKLNGGNGNG